MKRYFSLIFICFLLFAAPAHAAQMRHRGIEPETLVQDARILTDGGTIVDSFWLNAFIRRAKEQSVYSTLQFAADPNWGYKNAGSGSVSRWYDISGKNNDAVQPTSANQPIWQASSMGARASLVFTSAATPMMFSVSLAAVTTGPVGYVVKPLEPFYQYASGILVSNSTNNYNTLIYGTTSLKVGVNNASGTYSTAVIANNTPALIEESNGYLYINGSQDTGLGHYSPASMAVAWIGSSYSASFGYGGGMGTIIIGTGTNTISTMQQQAIEAVLNGYYGIY